MEEGKKPQNPQWKPSKSMKKRSSLFGKTFTWQKSIHDEPEEIKITNEEYHQRMSEELRQWDQLFQQKYEKLRGIKNTELVADARYLTGESRNYIQTGVDLLGEYAAKLQDTKRLLNFYLEERIQLLESKNDLIYILNQISDEESLNIIEEVFED